MRAYHDGELGVPQHNPRMLWEMLMLEGFQAGFATRAPSLSNGAGRNLELPCAATSRPVSFAFERLAGREYLVTIVSGVGPSASGVERLVRLEVRVSVAHVAAHRQVAEGAVQSSCR